MEIYIILGVLIYICTMFDILRIFTPAQAKLLAYYVLMCSYVLSFMRWEVGTDWDTYIAMFDRLQSLDVARDQSWWGPGYAYLAVCINKLQLGYTVFLWVLATIALVGKLALLQRVEMPLVAVFVLYCLNFNDVFFVRQHIAAIFLSLSILYLIERRYYLSILCTIVCYAFHSTALAVMLVAMAFHVRGDRCEKYVYSAFLIVCGLLWIFIDFDSVVGNYAVYLGGDFVEDSKENSLVRMLVKLAFWLVIFGIHHWAVKILGQRFAWVGVELKLARVVVAVLVLSLAGVFFSEIFSRFTLYIYPLMALLFASKSFQGKRLSSRNSIYVNLALGVFLLLLLANLWFAILAYKSLYVPFKFVNF